MFSWVNRLITPSLPTVFSSPGEEKAAELCYIWIGPPAKESGLVAGHDIVAVIQMAKANKTNKIYFACLERYFDHYQTKLKEYGIEIIAIEPYLNQKFADTFVANAANKIKEVMNKILVLDRDEIRDRVTVKVFFSLFWLMQRGGYCADTNIFPDAEKVSLPAYADFRVPAATSRPTKMGECECWMMYSPPNNNHRAQLSFSLYYKCFSDAEQEFESNVSREIEPYTEEYHKALGKGILSALHVNDPNIRYWLWSENETKTVFQVNELNIVKYYYNTHKVNFRQDLNAKKKIHETFLECFSHHFSFFDRNKTNIIFEYYFDDKADVTSYFLEKLSKRNYPELFYAVGRDDSKLLKIHLDAGEDIDQRVSNHEVTNETPLHFAIRNGSQECFKILLERGTRADIKATYITYLVNWTAPEMARARACYSWAAKIIAEHEASQQLSLKSKA